MITEEIDITQRFEDLWNTLANGGAPAELHDTYIKGSEAIAKEIMKAANVRDFGAEEKSYTSRPLYPNGRCWDDGNF